MSSLWSIRARIGDGWFAFDAAWGSCCQCRIHSPSHKNACLRRKLLHLGKLVALRMMRFRRGSNIDRLELVAFVRRSARFLQKSRVSVCKGSHGLFGGELRALQTWSGATVNGSHPFKLRHSCPINRECSKKPFRAKMNRIDSFYTRSTRRISPCSSHSLDARKYAS